MGNLGGYQMMTSLAKKVGGPMALLITTLGGGYVVGRAAEAGGMKLRDPQRHRRRVSTRQRTRCHFHRPRRDVGTLR